MWIGEREIVTLGERGLGGRKRGGLVKWSVRSVSFSSLSHPPYLNRHTPTLGSSRRDINLDICSIISPHIFDIR